MDQESWISGHLHYHQSFVPVVRGFVQPLVVSLREEGLIDAFYVIPGCYMGNVPPEDTGLPEGCDPRRAITIKR